MNDALGRQRWGGLAGAERGGGVAVARKQPGDRGVQAGEGVGAGQGAFGGGEGDGLAEGLAEGVEAFLLQDVGTVDGNAVKGTWFVIRGSGNGELAGLRGEGTFEAQLGQNARWTLTYWFE